MEYKDQQFLDRDEQYAGGVNQAHDATIENRIKELHTCLPGIIVDFNPGSQTASVQPAIQRIFTDKGPVNLPVCVDVPVAFPGGGDWFVTFPVKAGDECVLMFSERAIDFWYQNGGVQQPFEYRLHDLSDGIAFVGLNSQPKKLTSLQMSGMELRNRSRSSYIRLDNDGNIYMKGNVQVTGSVTSTGDVTANGKSLDTHKHTGVSTGSGVSGPPQ